MSAAEMWAPQVAVTVVAEVREGRERALEDLLHAMGDGVSNEQVIAFGALEGVHFARLVLVPPVDPRDASTLILMSDVDGAQDAHLAELAERQGEGKHQIVMGALPPRRTVGVVSSLGDLHLKRKQLVDEHRHFGEPGGELEPL